MFSDGESSSSVSSSSLMALKSPSVALTSSSKDKSKHKKKRPADRASRGRKQKNVAATEKTAPEEVLTFTPPKGFKIEKDLSIPEGFSWEDFVAGELDEEDEEDSEMWLIRVPDGIKPRHLEGLTLDPENKVFIGSLNRKNTLYDIVCLDNTPPIHGSLSDLPTTAVETHRNEQGNAHDGSGGRGGGEEMYGLSCILPSSSDQGTLRLSQTPISRRLVITPRVSEPIRPTTQDVTLPLLQSEPRHSYPKEMLRGRFLPVGSAMATDVYPEEAPPSPHRHRHRHHHHHHHRRSSGDGNAMEHESRKRKRPKGGDTLGSPKKSSKKAKA